MRPRPVLVLTAALGVLAAPAVLAAPSHRAQWVPTSTHAVHLALPSLGRAAEADVLHLEVVLPVRDKAEMDRLAVAVSNPAAPEHGQFLTPDEVTARFGPTVSSARAVAAYLRSQGLTHVSVSANRMLVSADATVGQAERAFRTTEQAYRLGGRVVHANSTGVQVPAALQGKVLAVLGLTDLPMVPHAPAGNPDLSGFSAKAVAHAYRADKLPKAKRTSVAIITQGDMTKTIADLRQAEEKTGSPVVPVKVVYGGPKDEITRDNPLTGSVEWDLDAQMSTLVPGAVKGLTIYDVLTFTDPEVAKGINLFVQRDKEIGLSISLGECEYIAWLDGTEIATDQLVEQGALQGQSVFASTGDNGDACPDGAGTGAPTGTPGISWPSSGEWTTGVGGTTLLADSDGNVTQEIGWLGGGGGISPYETAAPWTLRSTAAGQMWLLLNQGGRTVPDVAAVADSTTGVQVYDGGSSPTTVGGTSVSSPLVLGLWARIQNARGDRLGLASYDFYRQYDKVNPGTKVNTPVGVPVYTPSAHPASVPGFRDIILGANGIYSARPGYDEVTGIGVLDAQALVRVL